MVLHADEFCPSVLLCYMLKPLELVTPHTAGTQIAHFPGFNEIVQSLHGLFGWNCRIVPVNLKDINVVGLQSPEGGLDGSEDGGAG